MPVTVEQAQRLLEAGNPAAAQAILRDALAAADPDPAHATGELVSAAALYARVLLDVDEPAAARRWAAYAHTASLRLYGADDERTLQSASVLAAVLQRAGALSRAAHLYRELVDRLTALDGAQSHRVLAARADLATVLHARGECDDARTLLAKAWTAYRYLYGEGHPVGIKMLARLGAMERDCGLPDRAQERFALAQALTVRHLPAGHRLVGQVAALARAPADSRHVCADQADDDVPAGWWPAEPPPPGPGSALVPDPPGVAGPVPPAEPAPPAPAAPREASPVPLGGPRPSTLPVPRERAGDLVVPPPRTAALVPAPRDPRTGQHRRQRQRLAAIAVLAVAIAAVLAIATGALIARARTVGPDAPAPPDDPATAGTPAAPGAAPPVTGTAGPGVGTTPTAPGRPSGTGGPASAPGATTRASATSGPPTGLRLRDDGDAVTLSWTYPRGASAPLILHTGGGGQQWHPIGRLPAGTAEYTVFNLRRDSNYCFTVSIAYATDDVATATPVCTSR